MNKVNAPTPDFPHLFLGHKHTHTNIIPVQGLSMNAKGGDEGQNFALHIIFSLQLGSTAGYLLASGVLLE
jgi:hypothetical protein